MKIHAIILRGVIATTLILGSVLRGSTLTDVAWATGVASVVGPLGLQAASRSGLQVDVEVYRETITIPQFTADGRAFLGYDHGHRPFRLDQPMALNRQLALLAQSQDPVAHPDTLILSEIATHLVEASEKLESSSRGLADMIRHLEALASNTRALAAANLLTEARQRQGAIDRTLVAIAAYRESVGVAAQDGVWSSVELAKASTQLLGVRLASESVSKDFSSQWGAYYKTNMDVILDDLLSDEKAPELTPAPQNRVGLTRKLLLSDPPERQSGETQQMATQRQVWHTVSLIRQLEAAKRRFVDDADKPHEVSLENLAAAKQLIVARIRQIGFDGDASRFFALNNESEFKLFWDGSFIDGEVRDALQTTRDATYVGANASANIGPIVNEVIQGILSQSRILDEVTSHPERWMLYNTASSKGSAGTHNAIIYFENMLTPVLKSATFDPSQLLLANAQIYKRATSVVAQVYGAPTAGAVTSGQADESLNLMNLEARKRSATDAEESKRAQLLATLEQLLDEHDQLAPLLSTDKKDWADYRGAAKKQLEKLSTRLAAKAAELEQN